VWRGGGGPEVGKIRHLCFFVFWGAFGERSERYRSFACSTSTFPSVWSHARDRPGQFQLGANPGQCWVRNCGDSVDGNSLEPIFLLLLRARDLFASSCRSPQSRELGRFLPPRTLATHSPLRIHLAGMSEYRPGRYFTAMFSRIVVLTPLPTSQRSRQLFRRVFCCCYPGISLPPRLSSLAEGPRTPLTHFRKVVRRRPPSSS